MKSDNLREVSLDKIDPTVLILALEHIKKKEYPDKWDGIGMQYGTVITTLKHKIEKQK